MASSKWQDDLFGKRVESERNARGWTQEELAAKLNAKRIGVHWTSIAKIEKGRRSVRINEAAALADLFGTSVDALLGRPPGGGELALALRSLHDVVRTGIHQLSETTVALRDRYADLRGFDFDGRDELRERTEAAGDALVAAQWALMQLGEFKPPPEAGDTPK